jgi:hypothetical protein
MVHRREGMVSFLKGRREHDRPVGVVIGTEISIQTNATTIESLVTTGQATGLRVTEICSQHTRIRCIFVRNLMPGLSRRGRVGVIVWFI